MSARVHVPLLGFSTFTGFKDVDVETAVYNAIKFGYRHIDIGKVYENEKEVGAAIKKAIDEDLVERSELYIALKLWCADCDPSDVEKSVKESLQNIGLEYVDNLIMHYPVQMRDCKRNGEKFEYELVHSMDIDSIRNTWKAIEKMVDNGLAKSIGVGNFNDVLLDQLMDGCRIKPTTLQVEAHPYFRQTALLEYCKTRNVRMIAYCPMGEEGDDVPALLEDPVIVDLAKSLNKTPAQIALRWGIQRGTSVLPCAFDKAAIKSNFKVLDWGLNEDEMLKVGGLQTSERFVYVPWMDYDLYDKATRPRNRSHPDLDQPLMKYGETDERGVYHNSFGRDGKSLESSIYMKRGIIQELEQYCRDFLPKKSLTAKNFVVTDQIVNDQLNVDVTFIDAMRRAGIDCEKIIIPAEAADEAGETSVEPFKNSEIFHNCIAEILAKGPNKNSCIISVGGGVVNNICGVLAGMIYRGIGLVHFTTTTMGMLDAALDFKQAINHELGKNLLGCYYPASVIVIDPECTTSLSTRHVRNGVAEALKHAICQSQEMVDKIVNPVRQGGEMVLHNGKYIEDICKHCIEIKAPTLDHYNASDFNEMCPQYGHAVGHAVEYLSWHAPHEPLLHGEAVAIGMCVSAEIAFARGLCNEATVEAHYDSCLGIGLPAHVPSTMTVEDVLHKMVYDKHFVKQPTMGLVAEIGVMANDKQNNNSFSFSITNEELKAAMEINRVKATAAPSF